jgi:hypothetical protein
MEGEERMGKHRSRQKDRSKNGPDGPALVVLFTLSAGFLFGYIAGEVGWAASAHPVHWTVAAVGGTGGWLVGQAYALLWGDIV